MLYIGLLISFILAYTIGFYKKKFVYLFLNGIMGFGIGLLSVYISLGIASPKDVGLGIIALVPVILILFSLFNVIISLIGGIIGILIGRRKINKIPA